MARHALERQPARRSIPINWRVVARFTAMPMFLAAIITAPLMFGWHPIVGRSMQPTLPVIGGYYAIDKKAQPRAGDLVVLAKDSALGRSIKRVRETTPKGFVVVGDNANRSMDSEWGLGLPGQTIVIPVTQARRVRDIWSPTRMIRAKTRGPIENWAQFHYAPSEIWRNGETVVASRDNWTYISTPRPRFVRGRFIGFSSCGNIKVWRENERTLCTTNSSSEEIQCAKLPQVKTGDVVEVVVTRGKGLSIQSIHAPVYVMAPFSFFHEGKGYCVKKTMVNPSDDVLDGKPGIVFGVMPPLPLEEITTTIIITSSGS